LNGVTHGIYASTPVLRGEDWRAYHELEQSYLEHFAPVGPVENLLCRQITAEHWRLGRFDKAEVALAKQVLRAKAAGLFEKLDKRSRSYAYRIINAEADVVNHDFSPVAANAIAHEVNMVGRFHRPKVDIEKLSGADKRFIDDESHNVIDVGNTILASLVPTGEPAPQERLDRQRRATMRTYVGYVAKLMELQEARLTVTPVPVPAAKIEPEPVNAARHLKLQSTNEPANQNHQGPGDERSDEAADDARTSRQS
jgi:hypothetical protein